MLRTEHEPLHFIPPSGLIMNLYTLSPLRIDLETLHFIPPSGLILNLYTLFPPQD